jgi:predicted porin
VRKLLLNALVLGGFVASAQAADLGLDSMKDPLPDTITWNGVTVYGVLDVGYGYQTNGLANSGALYTGEQYSIYGSSFSKGSNSALTNNALSQSTIGVRIEEPIGAGFVVIGKIETGFNPVSGEIADACQSLVRFANALVNNSQLQAFGDGSRCGQALNGEVFGGVSNPTYGTLKIGRQQSLAFDAMANYDPMALSYSMSLLGWSGGTGAGSGSTETARWDNSLKYIYQYGPIHAAFMFADGEQDSSLHGNSYAGNLGGTYKGFSLDAVYTHEKGAINAQLGTLTGADVNQLYYFVTDNEAWSIMGKYAFDLGGGLKDMPNSKLTLFAGFNHTDQTGAGPALGAADGTTIGGYLLTFNNIKLLSTRTLETEWAGAKYETGPWSFTGAYYHISQNSFSEANLFKGTTGGCVVNAFACSGDTNTASFLVDYTFTKHFDVYTGVSYSNASGGLAHSSFSNDPYLATDNTTVVSGVRVKF